MGDSIQRIIATSQDLFLVLKILSIPAQAELSIRLGPKIVELIDTAQELKPQVLSYPKIEQAYHYYSSSNEPSPPGASPGFRKKI